MNLDWICENRYINGFLFFYLKDDVDLIVVIMLNSL